MLEQRFATCKRTSDYAKSLPLHQFEIDQSQSQQNDSEKKTQVRESHIPYVITYKYVTNDISFSKHHLVTH